MIILGINAYHGDSSACLVRNGVIVAAAEGAEAAFAINTDLIKDDLR